MAFFVVIVVKTQQNFWSRFKKRIACWITEVESQILLLGQSTANYFADRLKQIKAYKIISIIDYQFCNRRTYIFITIQAPKIPEFPF